MRESRALSKQDLIKRNLFSKKEDENELTKYIA